jgi:drug/metabolite transporter (DMT)-like permease
VTTRTDLALVAVAVIWGSSYLAAHEVIAPDTVFAILALRFGLAALGLAVLLASRLRDLRREEVGLGVVFGAILSVILTLETYGLTTTSASNAGLIIALTIVITPLLNQRSRLPRAFYAAALVAVAGVVVLSGGLAAPGIGDLLILLAAVARALHLTVIARLSAGRTLDSGRLTLVQLITALTVFVLLAPFTGRGVGDVATHLDARGWVLIGYLAFGCTVFAFLVQTWAVRRTSPTRVSLLLGTEPLWAVAIGVLVAGDPVTGAGVLGAALILAGVNWARALDSRPAPPTLTRWQT